MLTADDDGTTAAATTTTTTYGRGQRRRGFTFGKNNNNNTMSLFQSLNNYKKPYLTPTQQQQQQQQSSNRRTNSYDGEEKIKNNNCNNSFVPKHLQQHQQQHQSLPSPSLPSQSPSLGLKLVFKRQSGDKYEISSPSFFSAPITTTTAPSISPSTSVFDFKPKGTSERKVKFTLGHDATSLANNNNNNNNNNDENEDGDGDGVKRARKGSFDNNIRTTTTTTTTTAAELAFDESDLVEKSDTLVSTILTNQPRVKINHSIPFPIALVEDKTNIVHTKALLLIHLYKSYASPCIICVLCKCFFSIADFSKHFHLTDEDLLDDDDDEDEDEKVDTNDDDVGVNVEANVTNGMERKRAIKLEKLRKKSYKILPYCLNKNNELSVEQLKIWKLFGERFTRFKQLRATATAAAAAANNKTPNTTLKSAIKKNSNTIDMANWDYVDANGKSYMLSRERLESDNKIVVYSKDDKYDNNKKDKVEEKVVEKVKLPDLSLSEDEDENECDDDDDDDDDDNRLLLESNEESRQDEKNKEQTRQITEEVIIENNTSRQYFYVNGPSAIERRFNYYENLSADIRLYIECNHSLVTPESLILYNIKNRFCNYKKLLLAQSEGCKLKWLCSALDLDVRSKFVVD